MKKHIMMRVIAVLAAIMMASMLLMVSVPPMLVAGFVGLLLLSFVIVKTRTSGEARAGPGSRNLQNDRRHHNGRNGAHLVEASGRNYNVMERGGHFTTITAASKEVYDSRAASLSLGPRAEARLRHTAERRPSWLNAMATRLSSLMRSARFTITMAGRSHLGHGYIRERESAAYGCA